jgi:uncharacterized membrane protein YccC
VERKEATSAVTNTTDRSRASRPTTVQAGRSPLARIWDRVLVRDIGLTKSMLALRILVCVPVGMGVGLLIAQAMGLPTIVGVLVGAEPAFVTCQLIADDTWKRIAARTAAVFVPFVLALTVSLFLQPYRIAELVVIVFLLLVQFSLRQWAPWGQDASMVLFMGYLVGLLLPLPRTGLPVLAAIAAGSLAATILVRTLFFRPNPYRTMLRTRRALVALSESVLDAAVELLEDDPDGLGRVRPGSGRAAAQRRVRRRLARMQEVSLTADGLLADPASAGSAATDLHRLLFDTHQAIDGLGRSADALVREGAPADVREAVRRAYGLVLRGGNVRGDDAARILVVRFGVTPTARGDNPVLRHLVHRIALQLGDLSAVGRRWRAYRQSIPKEGGPVPFSSAVELFNGRPKGAPPVLDDALASGALAGPWKRVRGVSAPVRAGIQAAIAVALTEPFALFVSGQRFYWGVVGVMIIIIGTNTTHERVRKTVQRVIGNVAGGIVGILLVTLLGTGHPLLSAAIAVVALAIGTYGFGGVYALWAAALIVVLCQVYAFSGDFSVSLIPLRIAENLIGAVAAVVVSTLVLPVTTNTLIRSAVRRQLGALRGFVLAAGDSSDAPSTDLVARSLAVDAATYQLDAVMKPVVRLPTGGQAKRDDMTRTTLESVAAVARELAGRGRLDLTRVPPAAAEELRGAVGVLASSIDALSGAVGGRRGAGGSAAPSAAGQAAREPDRWVRSSGLLDDAETALGDAPRQDPFRDRVHLLGRMDDALAVLADAYGMRVSGAVSAAAAPTARARRSARLLAGRLGSRPAEHLTTRPITVQRRS